MAARTFATTGVIREESESTPVTTFPSSSAEREAARPGAQAVTETAAEAEARRKGVGRRDVEAAEREEGRWARGEETDDESHPPKLHAFALTYAFLAGLTALGIGIAGGSSNYWVSTRNIQPGPTGPTASFRHQGLWETCDQDNCERIKPQDAAPFENAAQAFFIIFVVLTALASMILLTGVAQARRKAHSEVSKTAGLVFIFAGLSGVVAMSSYVGKTAMILASADSIFYNWSFGLFCAAWAVILGLVVPLCYIGA